MLAAKLAKLATAADSLRVLRLAKCCDVCSLRFARVDDPDRQLFTVSAKNLRAAIDKALSSPPPVPCPSSSSTTVPMDTSADSAEQKTSSALSSSSTSSASSSLSPNGESGRCTDPVCVACMGILQLASTEDFYADLLSKLNAADYRFGDFCLSFFVPPAVPFRTKSVRFHLEKELSSQQVRERVISVKEILQLKVRAELKDRLKQNFASNAPFRISVSFDHTQAEADCALVPGLKPPSQRGGRGRFNKKRKVQKKVSVEEMANLLRKIDTAEEFQSRGATIPPASLDSPAKVSLEFKHDPVFVAANYNKFSRDLPQTKWLINGVRMGSSSVEELSTEELMKEFGSSESKFHGAGREDIDVRMLGNGRPCLLEFLDPHRALPLRTDEDMKRLEEKINEAADERIRLSGLRVVDKSFFDQLKEGEERKRKSYRCLVRLSSDVSREGLQKLESACPLEVDQWTPVRVLHRRSKLCRKRTIYSMSFEYINERSFVLDLETQAGTYIKEFVHGDRGRTLPNVGSLLQCEADILQLDVMNLHYEKT